jgi:hypothetical protein
MVLSMDIQPVCAELLTLGEAEIRVLEARPDPAHEIEPVVPCELQDGHPGPHLALGQAYGAITELWLRWLAGQPLEFLEVAETGYCPAEGPPDPEDPGELLDCRLPGGHPGSHSFLLEECGGRAPSPGGQRKLDEAVRQILMPGLPGERHP